MPMMAHLVILKETGTMIGQCGLTMQDHNSKKIMEVGYIFEKEYWHHGYASEAAIACKEYAFNKLHAKELYSIIRDINIPPQNLAIRNGMSCVCKFIKHYRDIDIPHFLFCAKK